MAPKNLREVVRDLRTQVIERDAAHHPPSASAQLLPYLQTVRNLRLAYENMYGLRNAVGQSPPSPGTWRARIGSLFVGAVQRMLFWYTPQILRFNNAGTAAMEAACITFESQLETMQQLLLEIDELRLELRLRPPASPSAAGPDLRQRDPALDVFEFELRQELRPAACLQAGLQSHLEALLAITPPPPEGPWLDLGCGDGTWLMLLQNGGRQGCGVDSNARAIEQCKRAGLPVEHRESLEYLRAAPSHSFAVVTAFHELERHPFPYVFESVRQAARVLKPGGFLLIESTSPANLLESTARFWQDPANYRLLPLETLESLLQYCGFTVASRRLLHSGGGQPLPWMELELVQKLDAHFHGPRDYALIAVSRDPSTAAGL